MIRLTQEQVDNLEKFYDSKAEECSKMIEINKATTKPIVCDPTNGYDATDSQTEYLKILTQDSKRLAEFVKDNSVVVELVEDGKINIGTKFVATIEFEGMKSVTEKTLVETMLPSDDYKKYVSLESPVGKSIYGRSVGETFTYSQNNNQITMTINEIVTAKKLSR